MSLRMHKNDITLSFDKDNVVWHNDNSYMEYEDKTLKIEIIAKHLGISSEVLQQKSINQFKELLEINFF